MFSNTTGPANKSPQALTIILFDQLNTPVFDQANARQQESQFDGAMKRGLRFTTSVPLDPVTSQFRLVMQDLSTGSIGALNFPVAGLPGSE
jgi:hypothetical protein